MPLDYSKYDHKVNCIKYVAFPFIKEKNLIYKIFEDVKWKILNEIQQAFEAQRLKNTSQTFITKAPLYSYTHLLFDKKEKIRNEFKRIQKNEKNV